MSTHTRQGPLTRRNFLQGLGAVAGASTVHQAMLAMGLAAVPACSDADPEVPPGEGMPVVILGAGVSGLAAAYHLMQAGYDVLVLEASARTGGRVFTARNGSVLHENIPGIGPTEQVCRFTDDIYVEMGAGRIPNSHRRVLKYYEDLDIPYVPYIADSQPSYFQSDSYNGGKPQRVRELLYATQGYVAELLTKAVNQGALDVELTAGEQTDLLELLSEFGDLGMEGCAPGAYCGSDRLGCPTPRTVHSNCSPPAPRSLSDILSSKYWEGSNFIIQEPGLQQMSEDYQPTLLYPVGGMDMLPQALAKRLGGRVRLNSKVTAVEVTDTGVTVSYEVNGKTEQVTAAYCLSSIAFEIMNKIDNNFSAGFRAALGEGDGLASVRLAWQANQRFWQNNENQIYGGMSFTSNTIREIWYSSVDFHKPKGGLVGGYVLFDKAKEFGLRSLADRLKIAKAQAAKIHPEFLDEAIVPTNLGLSVAWQHAPGYVGVVSKVKDAPDGKFWGGPSYERLLLPERQRFFMLGDQVSSLPGWQEGALISVAHVLEQFAAQQATASSSFG